MARKDRNETRKAEETENSEAGQEIERAGSYGPGDAPSEPTEDEDEDEETDDGEKANED